ncbi:MAG: hypothetical protein ISS45_00195 [Candidatus Omnitrophica bacterium]|nr:hypothetical protein [Candidatus Omnitrophota bacterium]
MNIENRIKEAYDLISSINKEAYKDIFLLSNQVLSKNPFTNDFLKRFLNGKELKQHPLHIIVSKVCKYYINSFKDFILYVSSFIQYFLSSLYFSPPHKSKELILIDTYFLIDKIKESNSYIELYFPGLEDLLKKMNRDYAYLPVFYGKKEAFNLYYIFKILRKEKVPVLSEYQLLSVYDLLYLLYFIIVYPYHVLKFSKTLSADIYKINLLRYELVDTLDQVTFYSFSRYLQGKKIAKLPYKNIKVVSWYENQVIDKNLYKGLRANTNRLKIYGGQLFLYPKDILNIIPDENEKVFGIVPDKIITNGPCFIPPKSRLNYAAGPSLRNSKVFRTTIRRENQKNILVLLPYVIEDAENILQVLFDSEIASRRVFVKAHPAIPIERFRHLLSPNFIIVDEDIYKLFGTTKIIISAANSGTLIEATSLGIPAISIRNTKRFECNTLPEYGKGLIWGEVVNPEDLNRQIDNLEYALNNKPGEIYNIADMYKKMFFCEPTEENIIKAFDL